MTEKALEMCERGRARALVDLLSSKISTQKSTLSSKDIQQIAADNATTIVMYSIVSEQQRNDGEPLTDKCVKVVGGITAPLTFLGGSIHIRCPCAWKYHSCQSR